MPTWERGSGRAQGQRISADVGLDPMTLRLGPVEVKSDAQRTVSC